MADGTAVRLAAVAVASDSPHQVPSIDILGVRVDTTPPRESVASVERILADPWDGVCRHVVTLNPEYVIAARHQPKFADAISNADLVTADGAGVVLAARLLGGKSARSVARLTGVDLSEHVAWISSRLSAPLFFLGAAPGVAQEAADALIRRYPECRIVGVSSDGTADPRDDDETVRRVAASGAHAVLVAFGAPGQVLWIERNRERLAQAGVRLAIGVGGSFDYLSGRTSRAPRLIRRAGLEWLFRLVRQPRRWRRQLALPKFAVLVFLTWVRRFPNRRIR